MFFFVQALVGLIESIQNDLHRASLSIYLGDTKQNLKFEATRKLFFVSMHIEPT